MIKYNLNNINDWNFGEDNIIKVYRNNAVVFYKFDSETQEFKVCYAVVDDISQYSETEFEDVFDKATEKWYKLNNLNQYEEYGVYGSGRTITTYEGKLTIDEETSSRLPQGYTEVEYIRNSNYNAYINTGVIPYDNTSNRFTVTAKVKSEYHSNLACATIIACEEVASPYYGFGYRYKCSAQQNVLEFFGADGTVSHTSAATSDSAVTVTFTKTANSSKTMDVPLYIFGACGNASYTSATRYSDSTLYSMSVVKNNETIRDFVPAKRDSDSKYGLYDLVTDTFYVSPNGNDFNGGEPVIQPTKTYEYIYSGGSWVNVGEVSGSTRLPQGYTEVEYVENTSSAYINTNLVLLENIGDSFEIKVKTYFTPYGRDFEYLFGTEQTSAPYTGIQLRYYQRNLQYNSDSNVVWTHIDNGDGTSGVTASCSSINATNGGNPLTLFCGLWSTGPWRFGRGKIYSFKVTKNDTLVRDLVPCKRDSDNMVGVYDLANDVFYYPPNYSSYQLIAGAETGSTVYPMYYDEKSDPLDNISFSSMTEAEEYAYNNCVYDGMKATIAGEKYYFDSEDENGWVKQLLPYDAEIEYLESTGTQYINTNTYITNVSNFEVGYELVSGNTEEFQWGWAHQNRINGAWVTVDLLNAVAFFGRWGTSSTDPTYKVIIPSSSISSVENTIVYKSNSGVTVNGTFYSKTLSLTTTDNITTVPLYFFARYDFYRKGLEYSTNAKFKSFYLKQNDVLVLDMIPVRVGQVGYMYDRVSGELFGNAGTSSFVLGADKN